MGSRTYTRDFTDGFSRQGGEESMKSISLEQLSAKKDKSAADEVKVKNTFSSIAGASSGDFHTYRHMRDNEMERVRSMQYQAKKEKRNEEFNSKLQDNARLDKERSDRKKMKRQKRKKRKIVDEKKTAKKEKIDIDSDSDEEENNPAEPGTVEKVDN